MASSLEKPTPRNSAFFRGDPWLRYMVCDWINYTVSSYDILWHLMTPINHWFCNSSYSSIANQPEFQLAIHLITSHRRTSHTTGPGPQQLRIRAATRSANGSGPCAGFSSLQVKLQLELLLLFWKIELWYLPMVPGMLYGRPYRHDENLLTIS